MGRIIFVVLMLVGAIAAFSAAYHDGIVLTPATESAAALAGIEPGPAAEFSAAGTLVFYPNNVGPVPYLFYQDASGHTAARALVFPAGAPSDFSSWSAGRISVAGVVEDEHVVVTSITYLGGPSS